MNKTITFDIFNPASVDKAIHEMEQFIQWLEKKADELRKELAETLRDIADVNFSGEIYDEIIHEGMRIPNVNVYVKPDGIYSIVIAEGPEAVFVEFGAGVYYNPGGSPHPDIPPNVAQIGTYGKGYGSRQIWAFRDEDNVLHFTHGTPASMPMYNAVQAVLRDLPAIAKKVFGS